MYARAVDDAAARLRALRAEEWSDLGLSAVALGLALVATQVFPALVVPLFLGGLFVGALGMRASSRRWELVERLSGDRDAYVIPEVFAHASREATMDRRHSFANLIRSRLPQPGLLDESRLDAVADELRALASELDDDTLALDPAAAVACVRLLTDVEGSPLVNRARPVEDLRSRVCQIRSGFTPRRPWPDLERVGEVGATPDEPASALRPL